MSNFRTILMIEDDRFIGEMYVRSLRKAGYDVDWVVGGNDGVNAARAKHYDLILLDLMLPEKTGVEVLAELRTDSPPSVTHVIVMTNFDQNDEARDAMKNDADGYLIKADITPRKLLEIIAELDAHNTLPA